MMSMATTDETTPAMATAEYINTTRPLPSRERLSPARVAALLYFALGASTFIFVVVHFLLAML